MLPPTLASRYAPVVDGVCGRRVPCDAGPMPEHHENAPGGGGPRRHHRPLSLDAVHAQGVPDPDLRVDPARLGEIAHTTAAAIVQGARASEDPEVVQRVVHLVDDEGLDLVAALWSASPATTLPGALWRLYALRDGVRRDPETVALRYRAGVRTLPADEAVAGVAGLPGPADVVDLVDTVLTGAYTGELDVALERAASLARILAVGAAHEADVRDDVDPTWATRTTHSASALRRTADDLHEAAALWRRGELH